MDHGQEQQADCGEPAAPRHRRDAAQTRRCLLGEARHRFARYGYSTTTVRDIADGAGVNVALINRYFTSKEGLFQACLDDAVTDLRHDTSDASLSEVAAKIARRLTAPADEPALLDGMLLLLRTSGDERVDSVRRDALLALSERLTVAAGSPRPPGDDALLRAQMVLATALGIALVRASVGVEPLATATEEEIRGPLTDLVRSLLAPAGSRGPA
ncbi:TetR/AcrR family transcriptional regulator [Herbidospora sp. RD11066]